MTGLTLGLVIGGAEILLIAFGLLTVAWLRSRRLSRRDRNAAQTRIAKLRKQRDQREAQIRERLAERLSLPDDVLNTSTAVLLRDEMRLYQHFANLYVKRDADAAMKFDVALEAGLAPYWSLLEQTGEVAYVQPQPGEADPAEVERLNRENHELREELQVTMDTMSRLPNSAL